MAYDPANRGGGSGSNYTFSRTASGQGNWNTGGAPVSTGSFARGFSPIGNQDTNRVGMPTVNNRPFVTPTFAPPQIPIPRPNPWTKDFGTITDVFGPSYPVDPGIIAQMIRNNRPNYGTVPPGGVGTQYGGEFPGIPVSSAPGSTFHKQPARGSFIGRGAGYGNDQFGSTFGGLGNSGGGSVGGGFGGGGGGGWR